MKQRGRKSAASLVLANADVHLINRPAPAADLTEIQRHYWVEIANSLPADWWGDENKAILAEYCRTLSTLAFLNAQIDSEEEKAAADITLGLYLELLKRREAMVRIQLSQATKMRLTQQSRYGARSAESASRQPLSKTKPWQLGG